ncbi:MAG: RNA polymerase subunit sigma [Clostridia bacterium]|nr:RNA polymerase subunit sigma [Clostridia bacterium]
MELEEKVLKAKSDDLIRNELLGDYLNFILSSAGKTLGRRITRDDDACSVAMLAFNEAIDKFDSSRGKFLSFAGVMIRSRVTDWLRKEYRENNGTIPFSSIVNDEETEFDVEDPQAGVSDAAIEIECVREELEKYDISFFDLPQCTPKSFKTKLGCKKVIKFILEHGELIKTIEEKHMLPTKKIIDALKVNEKLIERHRKYIIACVVILSGEYEIISEYLKFLKKGGGI